MQGTGTSSEFLNKTIDCQWILRSFGAHIYMQAQPSRVALFFWGHNKKVVSICCNIVIKSEGVSSIFHLRYLLCLGIFF